MTRFPYWLPILGAAAWLYAPLASAQELQLPADVAWCETLPVVAEKVGIKDTSESGRAYRADGVYLVTGDLWGHAGNHTVVFEEYGEQQFLVEVEFRMFRLASAWDDIIGRLNEGLGAGTSEVVAKASTGADGEVTAGQRTRHTYRDPGGAWEVVAHQMSNEIDTVKYAYDRRLCQPAVTEEATTDETTKSRDEVDVFSYDPYADDPLHGDTRAQEIEEEKKRVEEEKKDEQEKDSTDIDWSDVDTNKEDTEIEW